MGRKTFGTLQRKSSGLFVAHWMVRGKRFSKSTGTSDRGEAEKKLEEFVKPFLLANEEDALGVMVSRLKGVRDEIQRMEDEKPALSLKDTWQAYVDSPRRPKRASKNTLDMLKSRFDLFVEWCGENAPETVELRQVTPRMAVNFSNALKADYHFTSTTYNKYLNLFAAIWRVLKAEARLICNPWDKSEITRDPLDEHNRRELTVEELRRVCSAATGEMKGLFALGIYTGFRLGDCATLTWGMIDMVRRIIIKRLNKTANSTKKVVEVPIHSVLYAMLQKVAEEERQGPVLPEISKRYKKDPSDVTKDVQALFESCGIQTNTRIDGIDRAAVDVGFHSLRHSFVSLCANGGVPLALVQSIVGHASAATTQRFYYHESMDALKNAVAILPDITELDASKGEKSLAAIKLQAIETDVLSLPKKELRQLQAFIKKHLAEMAK